MNNKKYTFSHIYTSCAKKILLHKVVAIFSIFLQNTEWLKKMDSIEK